MSKTNTGIHTKVRTQKLKRHRTVQNLQLATHMLLAIANGIRSQSEPTPKPVPNSVRNLARAQPTTWSKPSPKPGTSSPKPGPSPIRNLVRAQSETWSETSPKPCPSPDRNLVRAQSENSTVFFLSVHLRKHFTQTTKSMRKNKTGTVTIPRFGLTN